MHILILRKIDNERQTIQNDNLDSSQYIFLEIPKFIQFLLPVEET